ncbi:hypothetical protein NQ315_012897 [Exocentrus adspersus]|uniref:Uncharacterized protein n=1 Tax=Exocentrus adspersus TaxID=1586481 RepID=A0AAV8VGK4_9CUCU|nr:hypothetical protein NQ315_012897 [Exocentrus adspersus]
MEEETGDEDIIPKRPLGICQAYKLIHDEHQLGLFRKLHKFPKWNLEIWYTRVFGNSLTLNETIL